MTAKEIVLRAFFHSGQLRHHPQAYFSRGRMRAPQEVPERAVQLLSAARKLGMRVETPQDYGRDPLLAVHGDGYLRFLETSYSEWKSIPEDWGDEVMSTIYVREPNAMRGILAQAGRYLADGSCPVGEQTWHSAYWSAQSAIGAAHAVLEGARSAYALCRPPGHHARHEAAGGFSYLNNAAIAAATLRQTFDRVVVLDTDMHHGQGIQQIFYDRRDVMYISIHGDPTNFYPAVAGFADERGTGPGTGFNLNLPMPHKSPETTFFDCLDRAIAAIRDFDADAVVLALGFDIYQNDPQSQVAVTREGFARLGASIRALSLPCVIVQEGGYHIETLEENCMAFFGNIEGWQP